MRNSMSVGSIRHYNLYCNFHYMCNFYYIKVYDSVFKTFLSDERHVVRSIAKKTNLLKRKKQSSIHNLFP